MKEPETPIAAPQFAQIATTPVVRLAPVALGLTTLSALPIIATLLSADHGFIYHLTGNASRVLIPVLILIAVGWLIILSLLALVERGRTLHRIAWTLIIAMLPWFALKAVGAMSSQTIPRSLGQTFFVAGIAAFFAVTALWKPAYYLRFTSARNFTATILAFFSVVGLIIVGQLAWFTHQASGMNDAPPMHHQALTAAAPHPRIVWLIFDELSYRQVYEHRFPGLALPAFDRLAAQSTLFTNTAPAGIATEFVIPSLISGLPATEMHASIDARTLYLRDSADKHGWQQFDPHQTVFQDAIDRGYETAVAGWYNPYCRILPGVLDRCTWASHGPGPSGMSTDRTIAENLLMPLRRLWVYAKYYRPFNRHRVSGELLFTQAHLHDYRDLFTASDNLLDDPSMDFLFLHLPVPHPAGIYNRHTNQLTTDPATYVDNLALADAYLANLRSKLEQSGQWDATTLLVMGDHSWRTNVGAKWASTPNWTPEEQAASEGGQFDDRPVYLLKLPAQLTPAHIDSRFPALKTRSLLDALMNHQIESPGALAAWAEDRH